jgi:hypothetical protein
MTYDCSKQKSADAMIVDRLMIASMCCANVAAVGVAAGASLACAVKGFSSSSSSSSSALAFVGYSSAAAAQAALDDCLLEVLTR